VDTWEVQNGKWNKTGVVQYDFHANYWIGPFLLGALTFSCSGAVRVTPGGNGAAIVATLPSTPQADEVLKGNLDEAAACPPNYHIGFYNCNVFVQEHLLDGIRVPQTPPSTDPYPSKPSPDDPRREAPGWHRDDADAGKWIPDNPQAIGWVPI